MSDWSSTVERLVNVEGAWIRQSGFDAIEPTISGKARVHLRGGTTVDIEPPSGVLLSKFITDTATRLFKNDEAN